MRITALTVATTTAVLLATTLPLSALVTYTIENLGVHNSSTPEWFDVNNVGQVSATGIGGGYF